MKTLVMDTASKFLYFSFLDNDEVIYERFLEGHNNHSDNLLKEIDLALKATNLNFKDFSKVIVGIGPGSYTGLRVSLTVSKMLAWSLNIPLYKVSSLSLLGSGYLSEDGIYAITMKAKKNHLYAKLIEVKDSKINEIYHDLFSEENSFFEKIKEYNYYLVNEDNYKINLEMLSLELVEEVHHLVPNYIQKEV